MNEEGVRHFALFGWTTDGRKWYEIVNLTDELISCAGIKLLIFIIGPANSWDERHNCTTRKITFRQLSDMEWAELTGNWNG